MHLLLMAAYTQRTPCSRWARMQSRPKLVLPDLLGPFTISAWPLPRGVNASTACAATDESHEKSDAKCDAMTDPCQKGSEGPQPARSLLFCVSLLVTQRKWGRRLNRPQMPRDCWVLLAAMTIDWMTNSNFKQLVFSSSPSLIAG